MKEYEETIVEATRRDMRTWPTGEPVSAQERTRAITLEVILRAVFGVEAERMDPLREAIGGLFQPLRWPMLLRIALSRPTAERPKGAFGQALDGLDEEVYAEIARRRAMADLGERKDILSLLMQARDEEGAAMQDSELRDELVTLLLAGHETTATTVAWAIERLVRHPDKLERLTAECERGESDEYVQAVVSETLRVRPVVPLVIRDPPGAVRGSASTSCPRARGWRRRYTSPTATRRCTRPRRSSARSASWRTSRRRSRGYRSAGGSGGASERRSRRSRRS